MADFSCEGFDFFGSFDSANIARVEYVPPNENVIVTAASNSKHAPEIPSIEFNIWTKPDCHGTEFENAYRTWFYFGMRANAPSVLIKLNLVDINRQAKMYTQGMCPVYRILPGKANWERIRDRPTYNNDDRTLSFKYRTPDNTGSITYFAFTYPFSYMDIQNSLNNIDTKFLNFDPSKRDDIYYTRELLCYSLEGRRIDLLTISSFHNIGNERETRLKNLFPQTGISRPYKFVGKKIIFISARVHPGETPSSFTFNGFLNLLLSREDPVAVMLRRQYVFKMIPCLNPDGVARGHYRTDTRGVNLNRVYLCPTMETSPSIYAARALIRYYHFGCEKEDDQLKVCMCSNVEEQVEGNKESSGDNKLSQKVSHMSLSEGETHRSWCCEALRNCCSRCGALKDPCGGDSFDQGDQNANESGLFLYIDMHGHASKKGIFMYGNHFESISKRVECMLLPKLMSINNHNFHFAACNFTEKNMYIKDKFDGLSKEGSGRVAVYKLTGLVKSYTLECNYNTGRVVNALPATVRDTSKSLSCIATPPKYTPHIFEEVGRAIGASILDLTGHNPVTRLPNSEYRSVVGLQEWLMLHCTGELGDLRAMSRWRVRQMSSLHSQVRNNIRVFKARATTSSVKRIASKKPLRTTSVPVNRKENVDSSEGSASSSCLSKLKSRTKLRSKPVRSKIFNIKNVPTVPLLPQAVNKVSKNHIARNMENTNCLLKQRLKTDIGNRLQVVEEQSRASTERIKLQEIHFIKDEEGKKVIAKYTSTKDEEVMMNDSLVVSWEGNSSEPQVFSQKSSNLKILSPLPMPGTSKKNRTFRVHNFARVVATKKKKNMLPLHRYKNTSETSLKREKTKKGSAKTPH